MQGLRVKGTWPGVLIFCTLQAADDNQTSDSVFTLPKKSFREPALINVLFLAITKLLFVCASSPKHAFIHSSHRYTLITYEKVLFTNN